MKMLDLFCGEGGAGEGYSRAGFDVTGVDIEDKPRNPHTYIKGDALEYLTEHGHEYDAIHASPPCQSYSRSLKHMATPKPRLIEPLRQLLVSLGKPWVIENVVGAPLATKSDGRGRHGVELCGTMFGARVYRHRIFETSFPIVAPRPCDHSVKAMNPHKTEGRERIRAEFGTDLPTEKVWAREMRVSWMGQRGARDAVPPVFTEYVGLILRSHLLRNK